MTNTVLLLEVLPKKPVKATSVVQTADVNQYQRLKPEQLLNITQTFQLTRAGSKGQKFSLDTQKAQTQEDFRHQSI